MALPPTWTLFGDDHLPHRLQLLAKMIDRESARQLQAQSGLSLAEWRVLAFVGTTGQTTAADICAAFEVDRAEVSRAIAKLGDDGLIVRQPDDRNRKRLILRLTEPGIALFRSTRDERVLYFRQITASLSSSERTLLEDLIGKVALSVDSNR
ncbi:MarR family winged helix-turn-helix transcriptional regulator [Novosphingobium sp. B 225]|uniref:MarR family winged helix-turn-helix transcriptional regulator n=1 Tax=Novosphingobium sp. B 225 TaxID=1961849 RepID=UPI001124D0BB|nr:MarR family transcriptional regulator [Novosphingobium sp. B 225]